MSTVQNRSVVSNHNPATTPRGGQASSPGLFGLPSATGRIRQPETSLASRKFDDQPSHIGGLSFAQRRARLHLAALVPPPRTLAPVPSMESFLVAARAGRTAVSTPAMLAAAYASDMREAFPTFHDAEESVEAGLFTLCSTELALAND